MNFNNSKFVHLFSQKTDRIYIIPSKDGVIYLFLLALILLIAILDHINLTYFVLSVASGLFFAGLVFTNDNLNRIKVSALKSHSAYVGEHAYIVLKIENMAATPRYHIDVELPLIKDQKNTYTETILKLSPKGPQLLKIGIPLTRRGKYDISTIRLSTAFPFGLFRSWSWRKVNIEYFAYPMPKGNLPLPLSGEQAWENMNCKEFGEEKFGSDFAGHKVYGPGDSPRHINWKLIAKGYDPFVKIFNEGCLRMVDINIEALAFINDVEERLCQVSKWINQCCQNRIPFRVKFSKSEIYTASTHDHNSRACLEKLAGWKNP